MRVRSRPRPGRIRPVTCKERTTVAFDAAHIINVDRLNLGSLVSILRCRHYIYNKVLIVTTKYSKSDEEEICLPEGQKNVADNYRQFGDDITCRQN